MNWFYLKLIYKLRIEGGSSVWEFWDYYKTQINLNCLVKCFDWAYTISRVKLSISQVWYNILWFHRFCLISSLFLVFRRSGNCLTISSNSSISNCLHIKNPFFGVRNKTIVKTIWWVTSDKTLPTFPTEFEKWMLPK